MKVYLSFIFCCGFFPLTFNHILIKKIASCSMHNSRDHKNNYAINKLYERYYSINTIELQYEKSVVLIPNTTGVESANTNVIGRCSPITHDKYRSISATKRRAHWSLVGHVT